MSVDTSHDIQTNIQDLLIFKVEEGTIHCHLATAITDHGRDVEEDTTMNKSQAQARLRQLWHKQLGHINF